MNNISEDKIKENWPNAVEGDLEHPELGFIHYWTGEQRGRIVVRFSYTNQEEGESKKMFFIDLSKEGWILRHISTFQSQDSILKLVKNKSFREQDELEKKISRHHRLVPGIPQVEKSLINLFGCWYIIFQNIHWCRFFFLPD